MTAVLPYAIHIQKARKKGTKRPQEGIPAAVRFMDTKIPQGIILPAAWICINTLRFKSAKQSIPIWSNADIQV